VTVATATTGWSAGFVAAATVATGAAREGWIRVTGGGGTGGGSTLTGRATLGVGLGSGTADGVTNGATGRATANSAGAGGSVRDEVIVATTHPTATTAAMPPTTLAPRVSRECPSDVRPGSSR
jgi:hypothetical protein